MCPSSPLSWPGRCWQHPGLGCCCSRQLSHGHSTGQEARQEQRHPGSAASCCPDSLAQPNTPLSFQPWALPRYFTKSGGQRDGAMSLLSGWGRWKEMPVLPDAPLGWAGMLPVFGGLNSHRPLNAKALQKTRNMQIQVCKPLQQANHLGLFRE